MTSPDRNGSDKTASDDGEEEPCGSGQPHDRRRRMLHRIAQALGVPAALLEKPWRGGGPASSEADRLVEAAELLDAFMRIEDPEVRLKCLAHVRDAASRN